MSFARVYCVVGVWFGFVRSALLLAVVCWVDCCFDSWVLLGLLCFLCVTLTNTSRPCNQPGMVTRYHIKSRVWVHADSLLHSVASPFHSLLTTITPRQCTASCGWNVRCAGVRGNAWSVMLSPCNTSSVLVMTIASC